MRPGESGRGSAPAPGREPQPSGPRSRCCSRTRRDRRSRAGEGDGHRGSYLAWRPTPGNTMVDEPEQDEPDYMGLIRSTGEFSAYPPIADYGFLSDCEVTALVAPSGALEWMCLPRMDCPSVFGAILDRRAGSFRFGPENVDVPADRRYLPGTMVLETSWDCGEGWIVVRDCLVMGPWRHEHPGRTTHIRPPTDYDAEHTLIRTVRCVQGSVQLALDCEPVFGYGMERARWHRPEGGYHQAAAKD